MQCILTREDHLLFYQGEDFFDDEQMYQPFSYTCPYCGQLGLTLATLASHVTEEHWEGRLEVICPVCVSTPGVDPNRQTGDLVGHLNFEHEAASAGSGGGGGSQRNRTSASRNHESRELIAMISCRSHQLGGVHLNVRTYARNFRFTGLLHVEARPIDAKLMLFLRSHGLRFQGMKGKLL